jgi:uncharacterized protein with HEPN domain
MRDKLIHGYFGVNLKRVWDTVSIDLPTLHEVVTRMLENKAGSGSEAER